MDELVVRTEVYADPETVYEFLLDFPRYGRYSEYIESVRTIEGDGGPGTRYALRFSWWKLNYTAHSRVTGVDPPERIDWTITKDIDAGGCWRVTPHEDGSEEAARDDGGERAEDDGGDGAEDDGEDGAEDDGEDGAEDDGEDGAEDDGEDGAEDATDEGDGDASPRCTVALEVRFDPNSASPDALDLPRLVSFDWVLKKAIPLIRTEAERVVERAVADLEGSRRDVDLDVYVDSDRI